MARAAAFLAAGLLLALGTLLAYIAIIAIRRNEGVFLPAGYVGLACLAGGGVLLRTLLHKP